MATHTIKVWTKELYTIRIYGRKTGGPGVSLTYGLNDSGTPLSIGTPLTTTGQLLLTAYAEYGDTIYISNDGSYSQCSQEATDSYCTSYTCSLPESFIVTSNIDISTEVDTSTSC